MLKEKKVNLKHQLILKDPQLEKSKYKINKKEKLNHTPNLMKF